MATAKLGETLDTCQRMMSLTPESQVKQFIKMNRKTREFYVNILSNEYDVNHCEHLAT
jgi:hypothetical protein